MISKEMKEKLFEEMLRLEHLSEVTTYDHRDYFEQSEGAYLMFKILGIDSDYIKWSYGK